MGQWLAEHSGAVVALALVALLIVLPFALFLWMTSVPHASGTRAPQRTEIDEQALARRLRAHVAAIASEEHNMANPEALERAAVSWRAS